MIESIDEIAELLIEYKETQAEMVDQFWMGDPEWNGKKQAAYINGVVLGKLREKDPKTVLMLKEEVSDDALRKEIRINLERNINLRKNMTELDIMEKGKLKSDIKLYEELSIYNIDDWIDRNCKWIYEDTKNYTFSEMRVMLYLYYAFSNFDYRNKDPYCSDIDELVISYKNVFDKQSQFQKYGIVPIDDDRELLTIDPPRIYDRYINKTFFIKNVPLHFLEQISKMKKDGVVEGFSVRLINEPGYKGKMESAYLAEALEFGKLFDFVSLGEYSVSKLYSEKYENCMWVVIDSNNITFEELCEDFEVHDNAIVTQVIHLQYIYEDEDVFITQLDHEYVFYTVEEYEKRLVDVTQKGEAKTRMKSFKIDRSRIPFNYRCEIQRKDMKGNALPIETEQFLCYVLETYFKHKDLLREYFEKI